MELYVLVKSIESCRAVHQLLLQNCKIWSLVLLVIGKEGAVDVTDFDLVVMSRNIYFKVFVNCHE
jgi:hypothetical protein